MSGYKANSFHCGQTLVQHNKPNYLQQRISESIENANVEVSRQSDLSDSIVANPCNRLETSVEIFPQNYILGQRDKGTLHFSRAVDSDLTAEGIQTSENCVNPDVNTVESTSNLQEKAVPLARYQGQVSSHNGSDRGITQGVQDCSIIQSDVKPVEPILDNFNGTASMEIYENNAYKEASAYEDLHYDNTTSFNAKHNHFEIDNSKTKNIPKKRSHTDTMNFHQSPGVLKQKISNESSALDATANNNSTILDTKQRRNDETNLLNKGTVDMKNPEGIPPNDISQQCSRNKEHREVARTTGQGSYPQSLIKIEPISKSGEENLMSDVCEEKIRCIAAKIVESPMFVTCASDKEKNHLSDKGIKGGPIATVCSVNPNKASRRKACRKKPLSQVIDMLSQELEQVSREPKKEIVIDTITVKTEHDDWTITEPETKRRPTRKKPSSLIVRLKCGKVESLKKSCMKKTDQDSRKTTMGRSVEDDPDYKIKTRSFHLNNKKGGPRKFGVKKKEESSFMCEICGKNFGKKSTLRQHKLDHVPSRPYVCPECNKGFRNKGNMVKHRQAHLNMESRICKYCNKIYSSRYALKIHTRKHTGERPFDCTVCGKKFYTKNFLRAHMNIHSGEKNIVCEICGKLFYNQANLYLHMRTHSGERPFLCTVCSMSFTQKVNLINHSRTHTGEKPFQCETCGHSYAQLSTLQIHLRTHTGEKPFVCAECGKAYPSRGGLHIHKKVHGGIKQFQCSYCEKNFVDNSNLKKHVRIHTGEKPYMCNICGRYFNQSSALRTHWKTHPELAGDTKKKPFRVMPPDAL